MVVVLSNGGGPSSASLAFSNRILFISRIANAHVTPMLRDIDITLLRAFTSVVDTGSVTAAAGLLNRTQSAISLQIQAVGGIARTGVIRARSPQVDPDTTGRALVGPALRLVGLNDEIWGQMTTPSSTAKCVSACRRIWCRHTSRIFAPLQPRVAEVRVSLALGNSARLLKLLEKGEIDLALTTDAETQRHAEMLRIDRLRVRGRTARARASDDAAPHSHRRHELPVPAGDPGSLAQGQTALRLVLRSRTRSRRRQPWRRASRCRPL